MRTGIGAKLNLMKQNVLCGASVCRDTCMVMWDGAWCCSPCLFTTAIPSYISLISEVREMQLGMVRVNKQRGLVTVGMDCDGVIPSDLSTCITLIVLFTQATTQDNFNE